MLKFPPTSRPVPCPVRQASGLDGNIAVLRNIAHQHFAQSARALSGPPFCHSRKCTSARECSPPPASALLQPKRCQVTEAHQPLGKLLEYRKNRFDRQSEGNRTLLAKTRMALISGSSSMFCMSADALGVGAGKLPWTHYIYVSPKLE
jgi:hypothetical protein